MMLFLLTLVTLALAMAGMALGTLLGHTKALRRGCTADCPCAARGARCRHRAGKATAREKTK